MNQSKSLALWILLLSTCSLTAQVTQNILYSCFEGNPLLEEVRIGYTPTEVLTYTLCREAMYSDIDNINGMVSGIYSGFSIAISPTSPTPRGDAFVGGINAEHTYPQSKGADVEPMRSDMHHLHPCRAEVNTARSNCPFAEVPDGSAISWFLDNTELNTIPTSNIDDYSEDSGAGFNCGEFEPRESVKGDIARGMFYFYTIYRTAADAADPNYFWQMKDVLLDWHYLDPVDQHEYDRTMSIASYQSNLPNPFVIDSTLARRAYCLPDAVLAGEDCFVLLPLEWMGFDGEVMLGQHHLNWKVAGFEDNDHFVVERSRDGIQFEALAKVEHDFGATFDWMDTNPYKGANYYRIKQVDHNDQFSYSKMIVLQSEGKITDLTVSPNPFQNQLNIDLGNNGGAQAQVDVYDKTGVLHKQFLVNNQAKLDLSGLADGLYIIQVETSQGKRTIKVVKD